MLTIAVLFIPTRVCMAGVWGEASPQAPPEGARGAREEALGVGEGETSSSFQER